jgi:A/G-specific adenine glycosylase
MPHPLDTPAARTRFRRALGQWFQKNARDLPWRRTHDPYAILVSEIMLQQTQVGTVIPYYERWLKRFPTVAALAAASEPEVLAHWQGLGYYARARNLHRAAQAVVRDHAGAMPQSAEALHALPGIGRYTAGAIASFAYDQPAAAVDANIARVLARLFDIRDPIDSDAGKAAVWEAAEFLLPARNGRQHTASLMELGALLCTPRKPACHACAAKPYCAAERPESLPAKKPRRETVRVLELCAWVATRRGILLERQQGSRWKGLWKLPHLDTPASKAEPLWEQIYPFTHHRVTLRVFEGKPPRQLGEAQQWFPREELESVALAAAHRRAVEALLAAEADARAGFAC